MCDAMNENRRSLTDIRQSYRHQILFSSYFLVTRSQANLKKQHRRECVQSNEGSIATDRFAFGMIWYQDIRVLTYIDSRSKEKKTWTWLTFTMWEILNKPRRKEKERNESAMSHRTSFDHRFVVVFYFISDMSREGIVSFFKKENQDDRRNRIEFETAIGSSRGRCYRPENFNEEERLFQRWLWQTWGRL